MRSLIIALAGGIAWGFVMALLAFRWDGAEVVLLQSWFLCPAWLLGRLAGNLAGGALAGFALTAAAVWTFELLPLWGVEAAIAARGADPTEVQALALQFDREDIALVSTLVIGALVGLAGALRLQPDEPPPPAPPVVEPRPLPEPEAPLWARIPAPPAPDFLPPQAPAPPPERPPRAPSSVPWACAFLVAALAIDFFFDVLFDMYSRPQAAVALALLAAGMVVGGALARRYAIAMILAGLVLGSAFAAVQHAEYDARRPPAPSAVS